MKIAVITHFSYCYNYGQRLQNIALVKYLKELYQTNDIDTLAYHITKLQEPLELEKKYINPKILDKRNPETFSGYDLYVFGSDQVWNMGKHNADIGTGELFHKNKLKHLISYASSECLKGAKYIPSIKRYFKYISFREKSSYDTYKILNSTYNIDPVFLQSPDFWTSCEMKPSFINDDEIFDFTYTRPRKFGMKCEATFTKTSDGFRCYNLHFNTPSISNKLEYGEFLWLIHNCRNFRTDSFHGCAFGLIYQKKNFTFKRNIRVDNLIEILNIKFDNNGHVINYSEIHDNIKKEQERAREYFLKSSVFNYCCYSKDKYIHDNSTSGGICSELAKYVFNNNGIVYAARYNNDFTKVIIDSVDNLEDYFKYFVKSKYNFSYMPKLSIIKEQLENEKLVMYIGSPCQILALKTYLKKDYDNLILVDFKCRGFSESKKLENFTKNIEFEYGCKIKNIDFRPNHRVNEVLVELNDGRTIKYKIFEYKDFVFNSLERCQKCKFDHGTISYSDITVSDFWFNSKNKWKLGKEFTPENGCNHVRTNTLKGFIFFNKIKENLHCKQLKNAF